VGYKRPNRGHGREMIQLGLPIADTPPDDDSIKGKSFKMLFTYNFCVLVNMRYGLYADRRIEPIPSALSDIIERLVSKQIIPVKPDACIIDFFSEVKLIAKFFATPKTICFCFLNKVEVFLCLLCYCEP
jgi:hypothetical protein